MAITSKKRKSAAIVHDDSDVDADLSTKRGKGVSGTAFQSATTPQTDSEGNRFWEISKNRRVTVSDFKGKKLVAIREYYQKDDEWLPGKKVSLGLLGNVTLLMRLAQGISLSLEQYSALIGIIPQIEELLNQQGETVPRPDYSGSPRATPDQEMKEDVDGDEETTSKKANIEATSDEDE